MRIPKCCFKHLLFLVLIFLAIAGDAQNTRSKIALVIHGGAGTILRENMSPEEEQEYKQKLSEALMTGFNVLEKGGTSTDAVIAAIQIMEESPLFNAGKGAVFTSAGRNELDASIMDGRTGNAGAVAGVTKIKSPIAAARSVMDYSKHVMLSGEGAEQFAKENDLEMVDPQYFYTKSRFESLKKAKEDEEYSIHPGQGNLDRVPEHKFGTVGAVALDANGNITAGTSTGGMTNKKFGRIGDSPIIGAGTYAENSTCGISATGHGEYFIRNVVAYDISALMKYKNLSLQGAAEYVIMDKLKKQGGDGGVIAVDRNGNIVMTFNTPGMYRGYIKEKDKPQVFIYSN